MSRQLYSLGQVYHIQFTWEWRDACPYELSLIHISWVVSVLERFLPWLAHFPWNQGRGDAVSYTHLEKYSYTDLANATNIYTGGISTGTASHPDIKDRNNFVFKLEVKLKVLPFCAKVGRFLSLNNRLFRRVCTYNPAWQMLRHYFHVRIADSKP